MLELASIAAVIGYLVIILTAVASLAGTVWYVFFKERGEEVARSVSNYKTLAESQEKKIDYLQKEIAEWALRFKELEERFHNLQLYAEELKKANLRLQGLEHR